MTDERATETVEVRDANAAHKLIGRRIDGRRISSIRVYPDAFDVRVGLQFVAVREWGKSVEVDASPAPTMWVHLDDLPGHTLPGKTKPVWGSGLRKADSGWKWWDTSDGGRWRPLTIVDHQVEVLAPVPEVEAPDEVTVVLPRDVAEWVMGNGWSTPSGAALFSIVRAALATDRGEA